MMARQQMNVNEQMATYFDCLERGLFKKFEDGYEKVHVTVQQKQAGSGGCFASPDVADLLVKRDDKVPKEQY